MSGYAEILLSAVVGVGKQSGDRGGRCSAAIRAHPSTCAGASPSPCGGPGPVFRKIGRNGMKKFMVAVAASAIAVVTSVVGVGQASAAPIPQLQTSGSSFGTFGDHSFCRGVVDVKADAPPNKRGVVRLTAISRGFSGNGATWKRNPRCRVLFGTAYTSVRGLSLEKWATASFGPRPGDKKVWEVPTGSGPASIGITTYSANSPVRVQQGYGTGMYVLVP